jgi:hypothetical protein
VLLVCAVCAVGAVRDASAAGKGMYYDKAFEQAQRSSGSVMALPEHTKVDCLYDLHYKYVHITITITITIAIAITITISIMHAAASLKTKAPSPLNGRSATHTCCCCCCCCCRRRRLTTPFPPPLSQQFYGKGKRSVH